MATNSKPGNTDFTLDVLGRFICNGLDEALRSTDKNIRPDARSIDIIVVGGGTFGSALAQHVFAADATHSHRILVLEGGPFTIPEHVQNLPPLGSGFGVPGPTSIAQLRVDNNFGPDKPREQVWGLAWHSSTPFTGLAYCVGGRSIYWGGWSPRLLPAEMPTKAVPAPWPKPVVDDLSAKDGYFDEAGRQIGVNVTNDFLFGDLQDALRQRLFDGINANRVTDAIPLAELPSTLDDIAPADRDRMKLEAPLAVQSTPPRPGFFPKNKFSAVPLLMKAARAAQTETNNDDFKKRLMVVPRCHVKKLVLTGGRVSTVETDQGSVPVPVNGSVIIALATIESARLALNSFQGIANSHLMGRNLMAHLRSNLTVRIPRTALAIPAAIKELQAAALFVKGRHKFTDGTTGHFHLQITAAGLGPLGTDSEAELFKKVPDIDGFASFKNADDKTVVITVRGIGEMQPQNPNSFVALDSETDESGMPRAFVSLTTSAKDLELWNAMDKAADDVAKVFAGGSAFEVLPKQRDGLGTTHHETGPLWMGDDPNRSVTNSDGRFHHVANAYVVGPALFPSIGSPNPMLTGIALARRLGDLLAQPPPAPALEPGYQLLFDGAKPSNWRQAGQGGFLVVDGALETIGGANDLGLCWCTTPTPANFSLRLQWLRWRHDDNSGVFIRFPHPDSKGYNNTAWVAVNFGFEVQIDELGQPDGAPIHRTGAIYAQPNQILNQIPARPPGEWNDYEIRAQDQTYTVFLNGQQVAFFQNPDPGRGLPSTPAAPSYIGLQAYVGKRVAFRHIRLKPL